MRIIFIFAILVCSSCASVNESILLDAIAMIETGNRDMAGKSGERGKWQMMPVVRAKVGGHDRIAAHKWLKIIMADMSRYNIDINVTNIALSWNASVHTVRKGCAPMSSYDYARRCNNLYMALVQEHSR